MTDAHAPRHLSAEGRKFYSEIATEYGINDAAGRRLLLTAAECLDRMRRAQRLIRKHGELITARDGLRANPACAIERDARTQMLGAMKALNLDLEPLGAVGRPSNAAREARRSAN
jgi:P27 family predicted phage terminase small subunit